MFRNIAIAGIHIHHQVWGILMLLFSGLMLITYLPERGLWLNLLAAIFGTGAALTLDEFAMWLDGSDELTAAERAEQLRRGGPRELMAVLPDAGMTVTTSIGIACRQAGGGEDLDSLMRRADEAVQDVKRNGRGHWRVSHPEPAC